MKPASHDIDIYRGDTFELFFRVRTQGGPYTVLTGWTGAAQLRADEDNATILVTMTVTLSNQTTTPGGVLVSMTPAQTAALTVLEGMWDVQLTDGTDVLTYIKGAFTVDKDVTRV